MKPEPGAANRHDAIRLTIWLGLGAACFWSVFAFYPRLLRSFGVHDYGPWFLDLFALLASNDAVARGLDPYAPNPLDYFHRPHVYSHGWLHLRDLGLTRTDTLWLGLTLVGAFLAAALSRLRPREPRQLLFYFAVLCSSPVLLAVNRANNDLVIFILLTPFIACLLDPRAKVRMMAPFFIAAATALKYYPAAAALVLLAAAPPRELRRRTTLMLALFAVVAVYLAKDLAAFGSLAPRPEGLLSFGANAFFHGFGWDGWIPKLTSIALGTAAFIWCWRTKPLGEWTPTSAQHADWLHFILGAALLGGCFFTSSNFSYRWIFALWLAPLLWSLPRDEFAPASIRRFARMTRALLLAVLWIDTVYCMMLNRFLGVVPLAELVRWADRMFLAEQPIVWAFFICMLAFLAHFTRGGLRVLLAR